MPRPTRPSDGVAWVTGASSGVGRETAKRLVAEGWTVVVTARRAEELAALAAEAPAGRIVPMPGDVTDAAAMAAIVERIEKEVGPLALLLAAAGVYRPLRAGSMEVKAFRGTLRVNVDGVINALVPAVAAMKARGVGQIAIIASVAGWGGLPTSAAYGGSKALLVNMAASLKFDLDRLGILIQVINPGFIDTPLTGPNPYPMPFLMKVEEAAARIVRGLAGGRFEITFPKRFTWPLKLLNALPYPAYFFLVKRATRRKREPGVSRGAR